MLGTALEPHGLRRSYVALAEAIDAVLLTGDGRLAEEPDVRRAVEVLTSPPIALGRVVTPW